MRLTTSVAVVAVWSAEAERASLLVSSAEPQNRLSAAVETCALMKPF
jgi:hypothetical protein